MKLSINIKHIEAVRLYYREESKEFWLEISTTSNKPIIVPYKDKEEAVIINPKFVGDYENADFNNAYCKLLWKECEEE